MQGIIPYNEEPYDTDLARSGQVANHFVGLWTFDDYHEKCTQNTRDRQEYDLKVFSQYLASVHVTRHWEDLYNDARAWDGITFGHLEAFCKWQRDKGYAIGSIGVRLATVRKYCQLAHKAGVIERNEIALIKEVKAYSHKTGRNIDKSRKNRGEATRVGTKKAEPTRVSVNAGRKLKRTTVTPERPYRRDHDKLLVARDALLMCLLTEHGFRCGEIANLNIEHINLEEGTVTVYREKTDDTDTYALMDNTETAARIYLNLLERKTGPLFTGYKNARISNRAINKRVGVLGEEIGVTGLSPHDMRHFWALDALKNGTSLDVLQAYGGWKSAAMPLHYAKVAGVTHTGLKISK